MLEKRIRFSFGRYRQVSVSDLAIGVFKKLPRKATIWVNELLDKESASQNLSLARLAASKARFTRQILETEPNILMRNKNRLNEIEIQIRSRIHTDLKMLSSFRSELKIRQTNLLLGLDRARSDTLAFRRRIDAVQSSNSKAFNLALTELRKAISNAFNPTIDWQVFVQLFPKRFPSAGRNAEVELASWVHSDPRLLFTAIENINDDLKMLSKSEDEGDVLRNIVNFARECRGGRKIQKDDWFDYRAGMFSRERAMPVWVTDTAKRLGIEYQTNFYLGTALVASGHNTIVFGLAFELIPDTKVTSSRQSIYQEPANGWSFGNRRYNLGGDR